ncbi:MAG: TVP38/TMEM64 family protein, partial [Myxococcota bacterium]
MPQQRARLVRRGVAVVAGLAALAALGRLAGASLPGFQHWVGELGAWGPAVFIAGYALAVVAFAPAVLLTLAAGATFGVTAGTFYVFVAAVLGSSLSFWVARYAARDSVERWIARDARFQALDRAVAERGWRIVLLMRLSPLFPFSLLNYALGITRLRFVDTLLAAPGMLPVTLAYVFLGNAAGEMASLAGGVEPARTTLENTLLALGVVSTLGVAVMVARIARRALE